MSNHNNTNQQSPVDPNWSDDEFEQYLVRNLSEVGRHAPTLNENARATVLQALLTENARLAKANIVAPARQVIPAVQKVGFWARLVGLFSPRVAMPLGSALAAFMVVAGYFLYGGSRGDNFGVIQGTATVVEKRHGVFNLNWQFERNLDEQNAFAVASEDEVRATSAVTITMDDGSVVTALPGSTFKVVFGKDGGKVVHVEGETAYHITPSSTGSPKFWVGAPEGGLFTVKGTIFRVRTDKSGVVQFTDEGVVGASDGRANKDVKTGEQVRISGQTLGAIELQVPRIQFQSMTADPAVPNVVFTNRDVVTMSARVYPSSVLIAMDMIGNEVARFAADKRGSVNGSLKVLPGSNNEFQFYVVSSSDARRSGLTDKVSIQLDKTAPKLGAFPPTLVNNGAQFEVKGQTEPNAKVLINGQNVTVDASGAFTASLPRPADMTQVQIVARDQAGNTTQIVQQMESK